MKIKTILISQPKPESEKSPYYDLAKQHKVNLEFKQFIKIEGVPAADFRKQKIDLADYKCIVLNSKNAVDHYFRMASEMRYTVPESNKYFCLTEAIALYLQKYIVYRKRKIFFAQQGIEELIEPFRKNKEEKFLFPSSDKHSDKVTEFFNANNIKYTQGIFFRTVHSDMSAINLADFEMVILFTPAGIESLMTNFPGFDKEKTKVGLFGPSTLATALANDLEPVLVAPMPNAPSMTMALDLFLKEFNGKNGAANLEQFRPDLLQLEPFRKETPAAAPAKASGTAKKTAKKKPARKKTVKKTTASAARKTTPAKKTSAKSTAAKKTTATKKTPAKKAAPKTGNKKTT